MQGPASMKQSRFSPITGLAGLRLWTAIAIIGISAFSVARGSSIVRFSLANITSSKNWDQTLRTWNAIPGIALAALQLQLTEKVDPSDLAAANNRREALAAIVSVKPLASNDWLLLSGMQLITDQPMDTVFGSLLLSIMTGPNEGYVMTDRGVFGASLWEALPPDLKRLAASDLAWGEIPDGKKLGAVLATKSAGVRNELRTAILATGLAPKEVERRLGF